MIPIIRKKLADAHNAYLEKLAKQDEIEKQMSENMPASVEAIRGESLGDGPFR